MGDIHGVYSDFRLYEIEDLTPESREYYDTDNLEVPLPHHHPKLAEWKTPPLWGVASSAPYLHDGRAANLEEAIRYHGGEASASRSAFAKLRPADRAALIGFLKTLVAPPTADPVPPANPAPVGQQPAGFFPF